MIGWRLTTVCDVCGWSQEHTQEDLMEGKRLYSLSPEGWAFDYVFICDNCSKVRVAHLVKHVPSSRDEYFDRPPCTGGKQWLRYEN